jgi:hypothetical protein
MSTGDLGAVRQNIPLESELYRLHAFGKLHTGGDVYWKVRLAAND